MSQNKNIVANNQNFIPGSQGSSSAENSNIDNGIKAKSENSRTAKNGFMNNGNASISAAEQGTRNKN